jgi:hypothetical protein
VRSCGLTGDILTAFGNVIGRNANFPVGGDFHHANLFVCLVGSSSRAKKGTSLGYVNQAFNGIDTAWRQVGGLSSGEGIINALRDETITDDDGTFSVQGVSDKRLWVIETEFGQTLRVLKRDGNTLSPVLRNAWDRGELSILTRTNPLRASNVHVSILGHITNGELLKYLDDTDVFNGFANRFLWALVKRSKLLPDGGSVSLEGFRQWLKTVTQTAKNITTMQRSESAKSLWRDVYPELVSEKVGLWDAVTSRAEAQTLRLSMLYALLDGSSTINEQHLKAALALCRYCDDSARIIFGTDEGGTVERKIQRIVKERPIIQKTELRDAISHKLKASEFTRSLEWLVKRGGIVCVPVHKSKKPAERYYPPVKGQGVLSPR